MEGVNGLRVLLVSLVSDAFGFFECAHVHEVK